MIPEPESAESTASPSHKRLFLLQEKGRAETCVHECTRVCVCVCAQCGFSATSRTCGHKSPADKHNPFQLGAALSVQGSGLGSVRLSCGVRAPFAHWLFPTSSPLNCSVLSCSRREKNTHTAELIFVVYREYAGFAGSKKTALTCMTGDKCVLNFSVKVPPPPNNSGPHTTWRKLLIDTLSNALL